MEQVVSLFHEVRNIFGTNWGTWEACIICKSSSSLFLSLLSIKLKVFLKIQMGSHPYFAFFSFFPSASHPRGQGWLPVILLFCVNVCCSITTTIKLFLSCSAVIESTAHDCCPRALGINHTDHTRMCVYVCVLVHACVTSLLFLWVTIGYEEHSFCPLAPGNANGLAKRSAGKWGIEELFHSLSSLSTYISRLHFPFHEKTCLWMLLIFYLDVRYQG